MMYNCIRPSLLVLGAGADRDRELYSWMPHAYVCFIIPASPLRTEYQPTRHITHDDGCNNG